MTNYATCQGGYDLCCIFSSRSKSRLTLFTTANMRELSLTKWTITLLDLPQPTGMIVNSPCLPCLSQLWLWRVDRKGTLQCIKSPRYIICGRSRVRLLWISLGVACFANPVGGNQGNLSTQTTANEEARVRIRWSLHSNQPFLPSSHSRHFKLCQYFRFADPSWIFSPTLCSWQSYQCLTTSLSALIRMETFPGSSADLSQWGLTSPLTVPLWLKPSLKQN